MKLFSLCLLLTLSFAGTAQQGKVAFTSEFTGLVEGYDHVCKEKIYVNQELVFTSKEHLESEMLKAKLKLPRGTQNIRIENWTLYKGTWELTSIANSYSINGFYDSQITIGKKNSLHVLYDLDDKSSPHVTFETLK
jgi:hypothetical protein